MRISSELALAVDFRQHKLCSLQQTVNADSVDKQVVLTQITYIL